MCGECRARTKTAWYEIAWQGRHLERRHGLAQIAAAARSLTGPLGPTARIDNVTGCLLLSTPTGRTELIGDAAELLAAAERLTGRRLDPLRHADSPEP